MRINLEIIQSELEYGKTRLYLGNEDHLDFSGVRMLQSGKSPSDPDTVYIGSLQDVQPFSGSGVPANVICAVPDAASVPPEGCANSLVVEGWQIPALFNAVQRIFDRYRAINEALLASILNEEPLQAVLDCCSRFFGNPVYIVDSAMKLVLYSSNLPESELGPAWLDTLASGFTSVKVMNALRRADLLEKLNNAQDPEMIDLDGVAPPWLTANIFDGKTRIASVGVAALLKPVSRAHLGLLNHVTRLLTTLLRKSHNLTYVRSAGDDRFLIDLLTGISLDRGILSHHLGRIGWKPDGDFFLLKILPTPKDLSGGTTEYSGKIVGSFFKESRMVILGDALVTVVNVTGYDQADLDRAFSRLRTFLRKRKFTCGLSMKFHCFTKLYEQYQLAASALEIGGKLKPNAVLFPYKDFVTAHLFRSCEKTVDLGLLCHPEIAKLDTHDRENNGDLLPTLHIYLLKERSLVASARTLNIHRNTLVYRLNKISGIIDTDLGDDETRRHLILSCDILSYLEDSYAGTPAG